MPQDFFIETEVWKAIFSHWWAWKSPAPTLQSWKKQQSWAPFKALRKCVLIPTPVAREQLGVPEIVYGRVSVMRVVLPVSAAVWGRGGKCLSVHLQVHEFVAWAWKVCGVAAAALGANQTQDQREEADTWKNQNRHHVTDTNKTIPIQRFLMLPFLSMHLFTSTILTSNTIKANNFSNLLKTVSLMFWPCSVANISLHTLQIYRRIRYFWLLLYFTRYWLICYTFYTLCKSFQTQTSHFIQDWVWPLNRDLLHASWMR